MLQPTPTYVFVRGTDGNLWMERDWGSGVPPPRTQIGANVSSQWASAGGPLWRPPFQSLSDQQVFVLGGDGNLWLEFAPFGNVPSGRVQVDGSVSQFQAIDQNTAFVLGNDGNLWLEYGSFGNVPPRRDWVGRGIIAFQALDANTVFILDNSGGDAGPGNLWLSKAPFPSQPTGFQIGANSTVQVDGNVSNFAALDVGTVYVQGSDLKLWKETGNFQDMQATLANRSPVDENVNGVQSVPGSPDAVYVQTHDGSLWFETGPWGAPLKRLITSDAIAWDADPSGFTGELFVIDSGQNLWYGDRGNWGARVQVDGNAYACQPLWKTPSF